MKKLDLSAFVSAAPKATNTEETAPRQEAVPAEVPPPPTPSQPVIKNRGELEQETTATVIAVWPPHRNPEIFSPTDGIRWGYMEQGYEFEGVALPHGASVAEVVIRTYKDENYKRTCVVEVVSVSELHVHTWDAPWGTRYVIPGTSTHLDSGDNVRGVNRVRARYRELFSDYVEFYNDCLREAVERAFQGHCKGSASDWTSWAEKDVKDDIIQQWLVSGDRFEFGPLEVVADVIVRETSWTEAPDDFESRRWVSTPHTTSYVNFEVQPSKSFKWLRSGLVGKLRFQYATVSEWRHPESKARIERFNAYLGRREADHKATIRAIEEGRGNWRSMDD